MATIPIEVIVQDVESPANPTLTPSTNTETNITVPDTGAGTIENGAFSNSSVASIIVPAVLLILALATICTLLIHRRHKRQDSKAIKKEKLVVSISTAIAVLSATALIGNLIMPATKAAKNDITDGITPAEDKVSIVVTRDGGVVEESIESKVTITSTSDFGYKVLLSMAEGVETANLYLDGNEASEYYISSTEGTELADNTWGYSLEEGTNYNAIPLLDDAIVVAQGDEPVEDGLLSIYYGIKVSSDLPTGTYSGGEIEYTLEPVPGFPGTLVYMQDMTPEICAAAPTPGNQVTDPVPTATLIDSRDNKTYTIAKLADGKCWMTQNLDLDLSTETTLTSSNTNITANWTPSQSTFSENLSYSTWNSENNPHSYDPGDVYYYTSNSDAIDIQYNSLTDCVAANHTTEECKHYHAGNYYNWAATIASNDASNVAEQTNSTPASICPAGWRLPMESNIGSINWGEIVGMIKEYDGILGPIQQEYGSDYYSYLDGGFNAIRTAPLWFTRAGMIAYGSFSNTSSKSEYWSSTGAKRTSFGVTGFYPNNGIGQAYGFSIRCIAQ